MRLTISKFFYKVLIGWGAFWTLIFLIALTDKKIQEDVGSYILALFLLGLLPLAIGIFFLHRANKKEKKHKEDELEVILVRLAHQKKGELSVHDVVVQLHVPTEKARNMLDSLHIKGVFDMDITEEGSIKYRLK